MSGGSTGGEGDGDGESGKWGESGDAEDVRREGEPAFEEPWQARAFAVAVSLTDRGGGDLPWTEFQGRLVEEIEEADDGAGSVEGAEAAGGIEGDEGVYYGQWLDALERMLVEEGLVSPGELVERAREFEAGERDASEFVIGEHGHSHDHDHPHDHGHLHGHSHSHDHRH